MASDKSVIIRIEGNSKALRDEFDRVKKSTENLEKDLKNIAKGSGIAFAGLATTVGLTVKSFATYETGLIGVGKTADLTGKDLTDFGKKIQKLSTQLPFATRELFEIAQAAGQLGVKGSENLLKFTETIAKLGTASDLKGEEAATVLTRILNITREGTGDIDKFASVIVALGNSFAASESQIAAVTTRVARATTQFGVSSAEAAAFGAALKAVGIEAEGGGSAVGRAFQAIDAALKEGGAGFLELQKLTGLTGQSLKKTFETDAAIVFQKFIEGLGRAGETTKDVTERLKRLGLSGTEILSVLPVLATSSDELGRALKIAGTEMKNATALTKEYAAQSNTLNNETKKLSNTIGVISEQIGKLFSPTVKNALTSVKELLAGFLGLEEGTKKTIATLLGITTAFLGIVAAIATLGIGVLGIKAGFAALATVLAGVAVPLGALGVGFITVGTAVAAVITNLDAFKAIWIAVQAQFELAKDSLQRGANSLIITYNNLVLALRKVQLATLEAVPSDVFARKISEVKGSIAQLLEENERLKNDNNEVRRTFEEVYDAIDAEKAAEKVREEASAVAEARADAASTEAERKLQEEQSKLIAQQEADNLALEQKRSFESAQTQIELFEQILREEQEKKFNNKKIVTLKKNIADLKKVRDKGLSDEEKADLEHKKDLKDADAKDKKARLDFQEKFNDDTVNAAINLGGRLVKEGSAAQKALFLISKAGALANAVNNTAEAVTLALKAPPGPPFNAPIVAATAAQGAIQVSPIAASAIGLEKGGVAGNVFGARKGDRIPTVLSDGEIVAPRKNFDEVIEATARQRGFVPREETTGEGGGLAQIEISFTDEAAEFITAKQLENTTLGTDRG